MTSPTLEPMKCTERGFNAKTTSGIVSTIPSSRGTRLMINSISAKDSNDWILLTHKIINQSPRQWVGFYRDGEADPTVLTSCSVEFISSAMPQHHLSLPNTKKCYRVGTYSRCFNEWDKPIGHMSAFFHEVKIIHTTRGQEKHKIIFFYGKMTDLGWDPD